MNKLFQELYQAVAEYYPIGLNMESPLYTASDPHKRLQDLMEHKFSSAQSDKWERFLDMAKEASVMLEEGTFQTSPNFKASIETHSIHFEDYRASTTFHIELSLLGPFYILYFQERVIKLADQSVDNLIFPSITVASNSGRYSEPFNTVQALFSSVFQDYKMIPFKLLKYQIKGLDVSGISKDSGCNIYQALFTWEDIFQYPVVNHFKLFD